MSQSQTFIFLVASESNLYIFGLPQSQTSIFLVCLRVKPTYCWSQTSIFSVGN